MTENNADSKFFNLVKKIVYKILTKEKLLQSEWRLGKVASIISTKMLTVYINGSTVAQRVPCNPDVTFAVGDEIWVICINKDSKNMYVLSKRAV